VIETGARFLLDPLRKHEPALVTADEASRRRRLDFYRRAVLAAKALGSDCVSIWSGALHRARDGDDPAAADDAAGNERARAAALERLRSGLVELLDFADQQDVTIGFEPEPGMLIDTQRRWAELAAAIAHPRLRLTLDIGHLHCQGETPLAEQIRRWGDSLVNAHIEDMRAGVHEHLMFGAGEIDFPPVIAALAATGYQGGVHVELSRHSHEGPRAARQAYEFLAPLWPKIAAGKP
jgi:sugar phosphate isomerase/epimerase